MSRNRVYVITGGIASGKSMVRKALEESGYLCISADETARELLLHEPIYQKRIVDIFGFDILGKSGIIDQAKLSAQVFQQPHLRCKLDHATHPMILQKMQEQLEAAKMAHPSALIFMEIPLYFEAKDLIDRILTYEAVIVVTCSLKQQIERLMSRNSLSKEAALQRIYAQKPLQDKRALADYVIDNSDGKEATIAQTLALVKYLEENK